MVPCVSFCISQAAQTSVALLSSRFLTLDAYSLNYPVSFLNPHLQKKGHDSMGGGHTEIAEDWGILIMLIAFKFIQGYVVMVSASLHYFLAALDACWLKVLLVSAQLWWQVALGLSLPLCHPDSQCCCGQEGREGTTYTLGLSKHGGALRGLYRTLEPTVSLAVEIFRGQTALSGTAFPPGREWPVPEDHIVLVAIGP